MEPGNNMREMSAVNDVHRIKIILVGPTSVGKSSIVRAFGNEVFTNEVKGSEISRNTVALDVIQKTLKVNDKKVRLNLFDTAGGEVFRSLRGMYYQGAMGALLVYDTTDSDSFYKMQDFLDQLKEAADEKIKIFLVGNKIDKVPQRQVDKIDGESFAKANGIMFREVSAANGRGIEDMFQELLGEILQEAKFQKDFRRSRQLSVKVDELQDPDIKKKKCC